MEVEVVRHARTIVRVTGEIDLSNVAELDSALDDAIAKSPDGFVVDASGVSYIDGTGIRAILSAWQRTGDSGGSLALVISNMVSRILDLLGAKGLPRLLICETIQDAFEALSRSLAE